MKKMEDLIKQINHFSAMAKKRKLTPDEVEKRALLRNEYRKLFKESFESRVKNIKIIKPEIKEKE